MTTKKVKEEFEEYDDEDELEKVEKQKKEKKIKEEKKSKKVKKVNVTGDSFLEQNEELFSFLKIIVVIVLLVGIAYFLFALINFFLVVSLNLPYLLLS